MKKKKTNGLGERFLRSPITSNLLAAILAALIGIAIGYIILLICHHQTATPAILTVISGGFKYSGFSKGVARICYYAMSLILVGLSVAFAFKTGTFNIGASGQYIVGGFFAIMITHFTYSIFGSHVWIPALIIGAAMGGVWAVLPGILNAYRHVNVIISGIMMNYIGVYLVCLLIKSIPRLYNSQESKSAYIPDDAILPSAGLDKVFPSFGTGANAGIIIAVAAGIAAWFILYRTNFGYNLCTTGANREAARYAGINTKSSVVFAMFFSGVFAGLAGAIVYTSAVTNCIIVADEIPGIGFTGIAVALLGMLHPIGVVAGGFFIAFLQVGGLNLQIFGFVSELVDIIIAAIIFSCAFAQRIKTGYDLSMLRIFAPKEDDAEMERELEMHQSLLEEAKATHEEHAQAPEEPEVSEEPEIPEEPEVPEEPEIPEEPVEGGEDA